MDAERSKEADKQEQVHRLMIPMEIICDDCLDMLRCLYTHRHTKQRRIVYFEIIAFNADKVKTRVMGYLPHLSMSMMMMLNRTC